MRIWPRSVRAVNRVFAGICALFALAAATTEAAPVWLVSNGFHTSLALRISDLPPRLRALSGDQRASHVLFGWGAEPFYTARRVTPAIFCRTICLPTPSALHVVPFRGPVWRRFSHSDVLRFELSQLRTRELMRFLEEAVRRDKHGGPILIGPGYFPRSRFYAGREIFWFPATCNVWSARALRLGGIRAGLLFSVTATGLVAEVEKKGCREQIRRAPVDGF